MRIWAKSIIPILCQKHLCAVWRESNIMFYGILENKSGWKQHPARKEFEKCIDKLWDRMKIIREEMLNRGYHPKELPLRPINTQFEPNEWQTELEQMERLKEKRKTIKSCKCSI